MVNFIKRFLRYSALLTGSALILGNCSDPNGTNITNVSWSGDLQPVFNDMCVSCHDRGHQSEVNLSSYSAAMQSKAPRGGFQQFIILPGDAANSPLYIVVSTQELKDKMPPDGPGLSYEQQDSLYVWINEGAVEN